MDLGHNIRKGVKWLIIGNTGQRFLEFVFGIVMARLLVPTDFGLIVTIQAVTGFVGMLTTGGMGQALIRAKTVDKEDFNAVFTLQFSLGLVVYLVFFLTAPWFADFFKEPIYKDLVRVSALTFLLRPFTYMHSSWLNREMDFKTRTLIGMVTVVATGVFSIIMALFGWGVWSLVLSGLLGGLIRNTLLARATPLKLRLNFDMSIMRRHGSYGSKIVANDILSHFRSEGVKLLLSKLAGPAFLGLFNKADSLHRLPYWTLAQPVAQPLFRAMAKVQDDLDQTKYMYYRVVTLLMVYVLPFFIGLLWMAQPFIDVVYGEKWTAAGKPLAIMSLSGFFYIIGRPCGVVLMAQNRLNQEMVAQIGILLFTLAACAVGLEWGLEGASWGFVLSQMFAAFWLYLLVYQVLPTRLIDLGRAIMPGLIINSLLALVLAATDQLSGHLTEESPLLYMLLLGGVGAPVYIAAFFLLPIPALESEVSRWSRLFRGGMERIKGKPV